MKVKSENRMKVKSGAFTVESYQTHFVIVFNQTQSFF